MQAKTIYQVCVVDGVGVMRLLKIQASSESDAKNLACNDALRVVRCTALPTEKFPHVQWLSRILNPRNSMEPIRFAQDLATLLESGVTVKDALYALQRREADSTRESALAELRASVGQGHPFSAALEKLGIFPKMFVATVAASEETGDLATGLSRYASHQTHLRAVRDKVVGACVYPGLLLVVGVLVIALLLGVVVPRFSTLIDSNADGLPMLSGLLLGWGNLLGAHGWIAPVFFLLLMGAPVHFLMRMRHPEPRKRLLAKIPGVAKVVREFQHLQMYRTAAILTSRGLPIQRAFGLSAEFLDARDGVRMQRALSMLRNGISVSTAFSESGLCDVVAFSMLSVAERTGAMPEMLDRIGDFYERTLQRNMDWISRLIEPVLMIVFGTVIGGIVVLMYLPIFDLASSIG